jgi:hypothetical protein
MNPEALPIAELVAVVVGLLLFAATTAFACPLPCRWCWRASR